MTTRLEYILCGGSWFDGDKTYTYKRHGGEMEYYYHHAGFRLILEEG